MTMKTTAVRFCLAAGLLAATLAAVPGSAAAQSIFYDWNGGTKQMVSVSPQHSPGQIIVSFSDRRLYHIVGRGRALSYPIAIPREQSRWEGTTSVSMKRMNPSWTPTPTMRRENPTLPSFVPGGHPRNPLGVRALYLGSSTYRIHGTDAPWTIGQPVSKGCIRMFNEDVLDLYGKINVGTKVVVTWKHITSS
jgi:lipoprotein-anchoring transpeptidase ErfK/SrfK